MCLKITQQKILQPTLILLTMMGCNPWKETKMQIPIYLYHVSNTIIFLIFNIIGLLKGEVEMSRGFAQISAFCQVLIFLAIYPLHRRTLKNILENIFHTWNFSSSSRYKQIKFYINYKYIFRSIFKILVAIGVLYNTIVPIFRREQIIKIWLPMDQTTIQNNDFYFILTTLWQLLFGCSLYLILINSSEFIIGLIFVVDVQFMELQYALNDLNKVLGREEIKIKIKELVDYHNFLYKLIKEINGVFKYVILFIFSISVFAICFSIFNASTSGDKSLLWYTFSIMAQLWMYCEAGQELKNHSEHIFEAILKNDWNKILDNVEIKNFVFMVTERAKRGSVITAGRFWVADLQLFLKVLNISFSLYTFMNNVSNKK